MNRIDEVFVNLRKAGRHALIVYLTAGYPDLDITEKLVIELAGRGVDIVELGIPFSDPIADGPTIQESSQKALVNKTSIDKILKAVARIRKHTGLPLVLMTYYNPVYVYGVDRFVNRAAGCGIDGLIIPDLPPEESSEIRNLAKEKGMALIFLLASNTPDERMKMIASSSSGFIYCLSHIGITGAKPELEKNLGGFIKKVRRITDKPLAVGFGISKPGQVRIVKKYADGAIVGSAVIDVIKKNAGRKGLVKKVGVFVGTLR